MIINLIVWIADLKGVISQKTFIHMSTENRTDNQDSTRHTLKAFIESGGSAEIKLIVSATRES